MVNPVGRSSSTINHLAKRLGLDVANTTPAFVWLVVIYPANQISITPGGSTGIRSDRARPGGSCSWISASVSASSRYGHAA